MSNVVGMNDYFGLANGETFCWLCQKPVSKRAIFCHACGTIQPLRDVDHFARLGVDRQLDIEPEILERQYHTISATLSPERFLIRGMGERGHALKQREALNDAYETLKDSLRRGRYWLQLHEKEFKESVGISPLVVELRQELTAADDPAHCDRIAQKAGQALEHDVMMFMQSLRGGDWQQANQTLDQINGVEAVLEEARSRRSGMTPARI